MSEYGEDKWGTAVNPAWVGVQKRTFTNWANNHLADRMLRCNDLELDLEDGVLLINLLEIISGKSLGNYNKKARIRAQKLENTGAALRFLRDEGIKLVGIGPEDITDQKLKLILGLIWTIILRYHIQKGGGSSAKNDLLEWVRRKIPEYNITNFKEDWCSGRAICALTEALNPGLIPLNEMGNLSPLQNADRGMAAAEQHMGIPRILNAEDMADPTTCDELSNMTYISYFRDWEAEHSKREKEDEILRTIDPTRCTAFGPGLEHAEVGYEAPFTIQAKNARNGNLTRGGDVFDIQIKVPPGSMGVQPRIVDNNDGTYSVTYTPNFHGPHTIVVQCKGKPIQGSPFKVPVDRSVVDPTQCIAYGPGIEPGNKPGENAPFTIEARNRRGDPLRNGGEKFDVKIEGPYGSDIPANVVDNRDGTYSVSYRPKDKGRHVVNVLNNGVPIKDAPFVVDIVPPAGAPDAKECVAYGPGLAPGVNTSYPAFFTIEARDQEGRRVHVGGDPFEVDIIGPNDVLQESKITDNRDGTYTVQYQPTDGGKHRIDVVLKNPNNRMYYEHIQDSPFFVDVEAGVDAACSQCFGPGLEDKVYDTLPTNFKIQANNKDGNPLKKGGDPFEVRVTDPTGRPVDSKIKDNGDGTYDVDYEPLVPGKHKVDVKLKDKPVANSPYTVVVNEGADADHCGIEKYTFTIRARSRQNKDRRTGGEAFACVITRHDGQNVRDVRLQDNNDGTYTVSYNLPEPGDYTVNVTINGRHIRGSPWKQQAN